MQAVGAFMFNPTDGAGCGIGSQLNKVRSNKGPCGFGMLLQNLLGQVEAGDITSASVDVPVNPETKEIILTKDKLTDAIMELLKMLESDGIACEVSFDKAPNAAEFKQTLKELMDIIRDIAETLVLLSPSANQLNIADQAIDAYSRGAVTGTNVDRLVVYLGWEITNLLQHIKRLNGELQAIVNRTGKNTVHSDGGMANILREFDSMFRENTAALAKDLKQIGALLAGLHQKQQDPVEGIPAQKVNAEGMPAQEINKTGNQLRAEIKGLIANPGQGIAEDAGKPDNSAPQNPEIVLDNLRRSVEKITNIFDKLIKNIEANLAGGIQGETWVVQAAGNNFSMHAANPVFFNSPQDAVQVFHSLMNIVAEKAKLVQIPGQSEFTIQLKPETLGKLQMKITVENGLITAKFTAETQQVKELLESNLANLRQNLTDLGIKVDQLEVTLNSDRDYNLFERESQWKQKQGHRKFYVASVTDRPAGSILDNSYFMFDDSTIDYTV
ncbi:flagellar hook-length control protein FliK [Thermincola potens]|uniref:Flagellar hook-length control protein n=1 Tax=Thermincola potens (strain JR) TaxID=635013 RepID=D5XFG8_THEPJ|nr:flagellar hook-length control protein FliK [Thermincola potens]ADG82389.1 flagellar hook-length control protein [Thermincola potens JR]